MGTFCCALPSICWSVIMPHHCQSAWTTTLPAAAAACHMPSALPSCPATTSFTLLSSSSACATFSSSLFYVAGDFTLPQSLPLLLLLLLFLRLVIVVVVLFMHYWILFKKRQAALALALPCRACTAAIVAVVAQLWLSPATHLCCLHSAAWECLCHLNIYTNSCSDNDNNNKDNSNNNNSCLQQLLLLLLLMLHLQLSHQCQRCQLSPVAKSQQVPRQCQLQEIADQSDHQLIHQVIHKLILQLILDTIIGSFTVSALFCGSLQRRTLIFIDSSQRFINDRAGCARDRYRYSRERKREGRGERGGTLWDSVHAMLQPHINLGRHQCCLGITQLSRTRQDEETNRRIVMQIPSPVSHRSRHRSRGEGGGMVCIAWLIKRINCSCGCN